MKRIIKKGIVVLSFLSLLMTSVDTFAGNSVTEMKANGGMQPPPVEHARDNSAISEDQQTDVTTQTSSTTQEPTTTQTPTTTQAPMTTQTPATTQASPTTQTMIEEPTTTQTTTTTEKPAKTEETTEAAEATTAAAVTNTEVSVVAVSEAESGLEDAVKETTEEADADPYQDYTTVKYEGSSENRVEQIQGNLPTIWTVFYYHGKNGELQADNPANVRMIFNGNEWQASELMQWEKTEYGIHYYVLLDTSGSVQGYFEELIDAINGLALKLEEHDTLTVYTVGNETDVLTPIIKDATAKDISKIKDTLDTLSADAERTYLNDAIANLVNEIQTGNQNDTEEGFSGRDIIFVLSDGDNDSNTGKTSEEVKEILKDSNIPVYAFMNKNAQATNGNAWEGIAAASSGEAIYVEDNDFSGSVDTRVNMLQDAWIATFSNTDAIDQVEYTVELRLILDDSKEIWDYAAKPAVFYRVMPDTEAPYVVSVVLSGDNSIDVTFSEFVSGANEVSAYQIAKTESATDSSSSGGETDTKLQVVAVTEVGNHTDYTYRLTLNDVVYRGDYCLTFADITDLQGNPLTPASFEASFENAQEKTTPKESFFKRFWWIFLAAFLVVLVVILLIVFHIIKKNKGIVIVDDKAVLAGNTDVKQHIVLEQQQKGQPITLYLHSAGKMIKKIDAAVAGSIIVGRSDLCDIFIDDVRMSRQHFAIEFDGESFYIQDLDTTNGTMLNGVKMTHKRRLEKNDRITAGSLDIVVRW